MSRPVLSPAFCAANGVIMTGAEGKTLNFGMLHGAGGGVLQTRLKKTYPDHHCEFKELSPDDFNLRLSRLFSEESETDASATLQNGNDRASIIDRVAGDAPVVNFLNGVFLEAISKHASDIHIESDKDGAVIRYRIDGILIEAKTVTRERAIAVSARLKILANLNALENRRPQDGHIDLEADAYSLDVRLSVIPTIWGESVVLRLLNRSDLPFTLDSLGFSEQYRSFLDAVLRTASGLILVTGPTGSGKTTTLAAMLKELNIKSVKIISIEDPVEYRVGGITQIQVNEELDLTFDALLRRIFRQDPDIIMIGEIRDRETAELAVRAALTGHLVFATLHTANAPEAVYRLQNMGIPPYLVSAVLRFVIAQRLIRKRCPSCAASGCPSCSHTGYAGRTVIAECIPVTLELSDLIASGAGVENIRSYLRGNNFKTLYDDAEEKVSSGVTTDAEIRRELGVRQ